MSTSPCWAPRRALTQSAEILNYILINRKRKCFDPIPTMVSEDSDTDTASSNSNCPRFLVIQSLERNSITKISTVVIEKFIKGLIRIVDSVKKIQNDCLLIETNIKPTSDKNLNLMNFVYLKSKFSRTISSTVKNVSYVALTFLDFRRRSS